MLYILCLYFYMLLQLCYSTELQQNLMNLYSTELDRQQTSIFNLLTRLNTAQEECKSCQCDHVVVECEHGVQVIIGSLA